MSGNAPRATPRSTRARPLSVSESDLLTPIPGNIPEPPSSDEEQTVMPVIEDIDDEEDDELPPSAVPSMDPAIFQQQMFTMMNLLTRSAIQRESRESRQSSSTPGPGSTPKEPKAPDPDTFSGQSHTLRPFLTEVSVVFGLQPSRFPNDRTKVTYMISLFRGSAILAIAPYLTMEYQPSFLSSYPEFVQYLKTNYGDPDERGTAKRKIEALRQTGSASEYFSEFRRHLAVVNFTDDYHIVDLAIKGLKSDLKDEVARLPELPRNLQTLAAYIVPLDQRLEEREREKRQLGETGFGRRSRNTNVQFSEQSIRSDYGRSASHAVTPTTQLTAARDQPPTSKTFTTPFRPRGPISNDERKHRMDNGLCLYCGNRGHVAPDCPAAKRKPTNFLKTRENIRSFPSTDSGNASSSQK